MTADASIRAEAITAPLDILGPMAGRPVNYQYDPPSDVPAQTGVCDPARPDEAERESTEARDHPLSGIRKQP